MPDEVTPRLKEKVDCPCGCGKYGTPKRKAWGDGLHHVGGCPCRRCKGSRTRSTARRRENKIAKDTGGERAVLSGQLSGYDGRAGLWIWEETSQEALVRGLRRWWQSKQVQKKMARVISQHGVARAFVASWDGRPQLVVVPYEDWAGQVRTEVEEQ